MTNQEFEAAQAEITAWVKATSFGDPDDKADNNAYLNHTAHAEYGATQH